MNIDQFKPAIVYTIYIASTPAKVWEALTSAEFSRKYFSGFAIEADLRVGGAFIARAPDGSVHISGEVIECDPPRKFTITWNVNQPELAGSGGKAGPHFGTLRERARRRGRQAHASSIARPHHRRRHPLRRPPGLA